MRILSIFIICLFLMACGSKSGKGTQVIESQVVNPTVSIDTDLPDITANNIVNFMMTGSCSEEGQMVTVVVDTISAMPAPTCLAGTWTTSMNLSSLTGASRSIDITANHATSGGLDAEEATGSAVLHPRVTIGTSLSGITLSNISSFEVRGTCSENGEEVTVNVGGVSATPNCTSLAWTANIDLSSLTGASRSIAITANHSTSDDSLDAVEATGSAVLHPRVTIATNLSGITLSNISSFEVRGACSENGEEVTVNVGGISATPNCTNLAWTTNIDLSSLTGASRSIAITANHSTSDDSLDAVEATGSAVLHPRVTIATNLSGITLSNISSFEVRGTCSENGEEVTVSVGGISATPNCTSLAWTTNIDLSSLTGASRSIAITANHSTSDDSLDAVEATGSAVLHPRVTIATDLSGITLSNISSFEVRGACSENGEEVTVNVGGISATPNCTSLAWTTNIDLSSLTGASRSIAITANHSTSDDSLDAVEATGSALLHPRVTIATNLSGITLSNISSFEVRGTCSENGEEVTVNVGGVSATPNCTSLAWTTNIDLSSLTGASRSIAITANHSTSDDSLDAVEATGSAVLHPRVMIATNLSGITLSNISSFEVRGTCSENGEEVTVNVGGISATPNCTSLAWTANIDLSSLTGASRSIAITANHSTSDDSLDAVEATGSAVLHPRVTIATDLSGITLSNISSFEVRGTCSENGEEVTVNVGGISATPNCTNLAWTTNVNLSSLTGASRSIAITANHSTSDDSLDAVEATGSAVLHPRVTIATDLSGIMLSNISSFEVRGACSENGEEVTVSVGGISATPNCTSLAWTTNIDLSSLTGASRSIAITANHSTSDDSLDAVEATGSAVLHPRVTIATDLSGITLSNISSFEVRGACSENGEEVTVNVGGISATPNCTSLAWTANIDLSSLTGASRSIAITANHSTSDDSLDAVEATGSAVLHPRVTIATNLSGITLSNISSFEVRGACSENGEEVTVNVGGISATPNCTNLAWTTNVNLSSLTGASRSIAITANHSTSDDSLDAVEATGSALLHPRVTIATNLSGITLSNISSFEVRGTCSENGEEVTVNVGGVSATPNCTSLAWTTNVNLSSLTGASRSINITANHATSTGLDAEEATGSAVLHPRVTIATDLSGITLSNISSFEVRGTCSENGEEVTVNVGGVSATPNCTSLAWTANIDLSSLTGASRSIAITANHSTSDDSLDAVEATGSVLLHPRVTIATNLSGITLSNISSFEVRGTCSENGEEVTVNVGGISATPNCTSLAWTTNVNLSSLTGASRSIAITANHATSTGLDAEEATGSALLHPRVTIATNLSGITLSNISSFEVRGSCSEEGQMVTVVVDTISAMPASTCLAGTWTANIDLSSLTGASRSIDITANHATSGGLDAEEATGSAVLHPRVMIATNLSGITLSNISSFEVRGTCSENGEEVTVNVGGVSATPNCTSLAWTTNIDLSSLTGASRSIAITANHSTSDDSLDAVEATGSTLLHPRVTIATNLSGITLSNISSFEVRGTCSENGEEVTVNVGGISATPNCTSLAWTTNVNLSSLTGASRSIDITANHATSGGLDAEEATGSAVLHPRVTIATDLSGITLSNISSFEVRGTCSENGEEVTVNVGGVSATPNCTSLAWTTNIDLSSLTGASRSIAITANHSTSDDSLDAEEATGSAVLHPRVTIATDLSGITLSNISSFEVRGTCSENGEEVTVNVGGVSATPSCTSLAWTTNIDLSSLTGASRSIAITANHSTSDDSLDAVEATGNALLHPRVTIATNLSGITLSNISSFEVRGTCSENDQPVTVSVGGVSATPNCTSLAWTTNVNLSSLTGASRSIDITANHATSGGLDAEEATGSAVLHPRVTIATNLSGITLSNISSFEVRGNCSENDQPVTVNVGGISATPNCTSLAWTTNVNLSSLTGASRSIAITANHSTSDDSLDAVEATGNALLHPRVTIATNLSGITLSNISSFEVRGTCSENDQPVTVSVGGVSATPNCTSLAWTTNVNLSSLTGASRSIDITANHATSGGLDAEEATGSAVLHPRVTIATNLSGITLSNISSFEVRGTCSENDQPVTVNVGGISATPNCTSLAWTTNVNLSSLTGASRSIDITANHATSGGLDAEEATGSAVLHPRVTIDVGSLADITTANEINFRVSGNCSEDGEAVTVLVDTITATPAPLCSSETWETTINVSSLSGGARVISITANHSTSDGSLHATQATANTLLHPTFLIDKESLESITAINAANFVVSGSCPEEGEQVTVNVGGVSPAIAPNCTGGGWTIAIDVTELNKMEGEVSITADHSVSGGPAHPQATASVTNTFICPENYVGVPSLTGYTSNSFCVMKYEAKSDGSVDNNAISQASGTPYVNINRNNSITKCTAIGEGYDLITNDEWQSLARNIELVGVNWDTGTVGNAGGLSSGHSDNVPGSALAAGNDDNEGCFETGQTCNGNTWNSQRRTHTLSNGEVIWDLSGNVEEWVKDDNTVNYGADTSISQVTIGSHTTSGSLSGGTTNTSRIAKDQFGPSGDYSTLTSSPHGGLGYGYLDSTEGGVARGGFWLSEFVRAGVFETNLALVVAFSSLESGFRCAYHP